MHQEPATEQSTLTHVETPFNTIGLAFSGGGFRAASFCLGTLSYLHELPWEEGVLLDRVTFIASASGGSITSAFYGLHQARGKSFSHFYSTLYAHLTGVSLLHVVFRKLNNKSQWNASPHKSRNFINAFALTYDEVLFDGATLGELEHVDTPTHLEELCFNTTEFYRGLLFRQTVKLKKDSKPDPDFLYGNFVLQIERSAANRLRMGDILAASSCFPAGFEPMVYPADFTHRHMGEKELLQHTHVRTQELKRDELELLFHHSDIAHILKQMPSPPDLDRLQTAISELHVKKTLQTGFMDGGIADNQGLESIMAANRRRMRGETAFRPFDLMLINDVSKHYMDTYHPEKISNRRGISIFRLFAGAALAVVLGALGILWALLIRSGWRVPVAALSGGVLTAAVTVLFTLLFARYYIMHEHRRDSGLDLNRTFSPKIVKDLFLYFGHTPVHVIFSMLRARISSLLALNNDVFLKRVRKLLYDIFLKEGRRTFRAKTNHVFDLSFSNDLNRRKFDSDVYCPTPALQTVAQAAYEMGTTLWFDQSVGDDYHQAALIACGQFTTCYNLLIYIRRMHDTGYIDQLAPGYREKVIALEQRMKTDYEKFKADPFWLYNELGKRFPIAGFKSAGMQNYKTPVEFEGLR
ncbi:MAG: patatin-like phospholipase family protein [Mucilaginibacter polytrichastri]|nr:patatin-like phospholipase family protein [Mucilaginibacter polytrichastri]